MRSYKIVVKGSSARTSLTIAKKNRDKTRMKEIDREYTKNMINKINIFKNIKFAK